MSVDVVTFGCRLNAYEAEVIRRQAQAAGLADTVVVNTCAVTAEAVRQSRQAIRRLKRERPDARIVVTGCAAQTEPGTFAGMPEVALVLGNEEKVSADAWQAHRETLARTSAGLPREAKVAVNDIMAVKETAAHLVVRTWERGAGLTRACGSAACAAAVAAARLDRTGRAVTVTLPGGDLRIEWRAGDDHVLMTGPIAYEYEGRFDPALFATARTA